MTRRAKVETVEVERSLLKKARPAFCSYYCWYNEDIHRMDHGQECVVLRRALREGKRKKK